jgi:pyruvate kinase
MVTMPSEAAHDYAMVRDLVACGMDTMRINCAHDSSSDWSAMIQNLRRAERETGRKCPVMMDLGGPKLRTGAIEHGIAVADWRPHRDGLGRIEAPARIWLTPDLAAYPAPLPADASLPLPAGWLATLTEKDSIQLRDARGAARTLKIVGTDGEGRWAQGVRAAYVIPGTKVRIVRTHEEATVGAFPTAERDIVLRRGDALVLTRESAPGRPARYDAAGRVIIPASIPCTLPEAFAVVRPGERIWFDDGKIGGVIRKVGADQVHVEITVARPKGGHLRSDKGINLPDSALSLPALTEKDLADLPFVAKNADLVGLSFVRRPEDIVLLSSRLQELGAADKGVVLKIESRQAFEALPDLLMAALRLPRAGIMIARGDLLVECGYERLAEIQEEILWLCEAAHLPVIWATQVLESLAQKGIPSRAEITDAAMGGRAECVMLNKGPHILEAIEILDSILRRMQSHQAKKTSRLRRLHF